MVEKDHRTRDGTMVEPHELAAKERQHGRGPITRSMPVPVPVPGERARDASAPPVHEAPRAS